MPFSLPFCDHYFPNDQLPQRRLNSLYTSLADTYRGNVIFPVGLVVVFADFGNG
jgi:hypothetical protein